ncbi:MAG: hypothetical protein LBE30_00800 [Comamonas sp.]|jgi:hypothetical protein|nr:hypothetical protein [Comamonas sp.]
MTLDFLRRVLLVSLLFNYAVLLAWFLTFTCARSWMQSLHGRWFRLSDSGFDALHYGGMTLYKIGILLFNLAPLIALWLIRGN